MDSIPYKRFNNNNLLKIHENHFFYINHDDINSIIIGYPNVGFTRYNNIWKDLFGNGFVSLGIHGDRVSNVLWLARNKVFPPRLKNVAILCGTKNINKDHLLILFKDQFPLVHL